MAKEPDSVPGWCVCDLGGHVGCNPLKHFAYFAAEYAQAGMYVVSVDRAVKVAVA